jgi:hypothetical protein
MATTTPNFGWSVPTSSDLVKNGATAIETLGDSIDASLVDLKGGTTGQVLAKATNTDMDFTWTTPSAGSSGSSNVAGKNGVINSNFSIWQRGTSVAQTGSATYTADRWCALRAGGTTGTTISRQVTNDTTNLPFIQYAARVQRDLANTGTSKIFFANNFETVNTIPFVGKTVTFSFYARKGANYTSASDALEAKVIYGTGTDQNNLVAYTGEADVINQTATLTTTWQRFSYSATVSTSATELAVRFAYTPVGTALANDYFEVTGVQLEIAASVSAYSPNAATFQEELAACQRYYIRNTTGGNGGAQFSQGNSASTTLVLYPIPLPVTMRINPNSIDYNGTTVYDIGTGASTAISALTINQATPQFVLLLATVASGLTQYRPYNLYANTSAAAYIGLSAEL